MDLDISIWALFKIALIAISTYILLPLFLVLRDLVLWQVIDRFIITEKLVNEIHAYAGYLAQWNNKCVGNTSIEMKPDGTTYRINDKEVSKSEYDHYRENRDQTLAAVNKSIWYIQRRSNLVDWLLKHYKQDSKNPIKSMHEKANLDAKENYEKINR